MSTTRVPTVGLFRDDRHRYYWNGEGPYPGVTTIIKALNKPEIIEWAKRETARCAIENYDFVADLVKRGGPDAAKAWLASIPDFVRDTAGDIGTAVHRHAEDISRKREITVAAEVLPYVKAYRQFLADYQPEFISLERFIFNGTHGYGGTFDWIARLLLHRKPMVVLGDSKTAKGTYTETAMQLAGLANGEWSGLPGDPKKYRIPKIDAFAVLHIRPDQYARGYRLIEYRVGPDDFAAFLACLTLTNWRVNAQPIGESIPRPEVAEAVA